MMLRGYLRVVLRGYLGSLVVLSAHRVLAKPSKCGDLRKRWKREVRAR